MSSDVPKTHKKLVVNRLTADFREAVSVTSAPVPKPGEKEVLIQNKYVGVNAVDVNIAAGRYVGVNAGDVNMAAGKIISTGLKMPFDIGLEAVGIVADIGSQVKSVKKGQTVGYISLGAYAEYKVVPEAIVFPVPEAKPEYIALMVCGLTSSMALDKSARITEGETVLVTAAAGGTGHIAVQWAKAAGCHVIGTCSSQKKIDVLKSLGCDRIINYKTEDLDEILTKEYSNGIDVIWETIGGKVFETCLRHLAVKGRLIIVGGITGYKTTEKSLLPKVDLSSLPQFLLTKSAAVQGFLVMSYTECFPTYFTYLIERTLKQDLRILLDNGKDTPGGEFVGLEGIIRGVEHLHSGASIGKVFARVS